MQLTTFTGYGLRCLVYLATRQGKLSTVREISEHYAMSQHHMVKIVHRLSQLGYIKSTRGKGGGICLAQDADKLRLGDIITQLEPSMNLVRCFYTDHDNTPGDCPCQLKRCLNEATEALTATLNKYTLEHVTKNRRFFIGIADIAVEPHNLMDKQSIQNKQ